MTKSSRRGIVLLAEDSDIVRRTVAAELSAAGYFVIAYDDALGALRHLALGERADALVTDIDMPGGHDGLFLAAEARHARPDMPVVYMSTRHPGEGRMVPGSGFVEKPFSLGAVSGALDRELAAAA